MDDLLGRNISKQDNLIGSHVSSLFEKRFYGKGATCDDLIGSKRVYFSAAVDLVGACPGVEGLR